MKVVWALVAAAAGVAADAQPPLPRWNPKAPENAQLVPAFSLPAVERVLRSIGARYERAGTDPAVPALNVVFSNGRKAILTLGSCDRRGGTCRALSIQSYWTRIPDVPPQRVVEAIERFNQRYAFAKAFVVPDGRTSLQRYLTADYGFVRGNLAVNLLVFANQTERFAAEVIQPLGSSAR